MEIYIPDNKVMKEAFNIIDEAYSSDQLEKFIIKCLKKYKQHVDFDGCGWYTINEYVSKQYQKEKQEDAL